MDYLYGVDGVIGFTLKRNKSEAENYYYGKNLQGDITQIYDAKGNLKAEYVYDAWGNHEIIVDIDGIGSLNPFRYRSYYFDTETGLYYLKSRYYDAEVGRFINADAIEILSTTKDYINGLNLYAYCLNNPIMMIDENGALFGINLGKVFKAVVNVAVAPFAVTGAVIGGAVAAISGQNVFSGMSSGASLSMSLGASVFAVVGTTALVVGTLGLFAAPGAMIFGAAIGGLAFGGMSIVEQGITNGFDNINIGTTVIDTLTGSVSGAMIGGASIQARLGVKLATKAAFIVGQTSLFTLAEGIKGMARGDSWAQISRNMIKTAITTATISTATMGVLSIPFKGNVDTNILKYLVTKKAFNIFG